MLEQVSKLFDNKFRNKKFGKIVCYDLNLNETFSQQFAEWLTAKVSL